MAPSRACKFQHPCITLLLVAVVFCAAAESKDYFSDPSGKLQGRFPTKVIQDATRPIVQQSSHAEPRGQDEEQDQPLEIYDMLAEENEVTESEAKELDGGEAGRRVTRDVWSDPSGPLKGHFSEEVVEEAVHGAKSHGKKHHGKKAHGRKHHGKRDHGKKSHKGSELEETEFERTDLLAEGKKVPLAGDRGGSLRGGHKETGSGIRKGKGRTHLPQNRVNATEEGVSATGEAAGDAILLYREEAKHSPQGSKTAKGRRHSKADEARSNVHSAEQPDLEGEGEAGLVLDGVEVAATEKGVSKQGGFESAPKGVKRNSTRTRKQSLKWGRKEGRALDRNATEGLEEIEAKHIVESHKESHKKSHKKHHHHSARSNSWDADRFSKPKHGKALLDRRGLSEADNAKLGLISVVTQTAAVRAVVNATEGTPVLIPAGGDGVSLVAVKVNTAQLQSSGFTLQNVVIPPGVTIPGNPPVIILVFSQFSDNPYGFTNQTVVAPVAGVTAYDAGDPNAGAANSTLALSASLAAPFQFAYNVTSGINLSCSSFDGTAGQLVNTTATTILTAPGAVTCTTTSLGTFTVVSTGAPALAPAAAPVPAPGPAPAPLIVAAPPANATVPPVTSNTTNSSTPVGPIAGARDSGSSISGGAIAGIVVGSIAGLAILALLALLLARRSHNSRIARMVHRSRNSEPLTTALIGGQQGYRAPVASQVRTRPGLEGEVYP